MDCCAIVEFYDRSTLKPGEGPAPLARVEVRYLGLDRANSRYDRFGQAIGRMVADRPPCTELHYDASIS